MACLLTWCGNFVCYDRALHRLVHVPWSQIDGDRRLVEVTPIRNLRQRIVAADLTVSTNDPALGPGPVLQQRLVAATRDDTLNARIMNLSTGTHYLCADAYDNIADDRLQASEWEHFLLLEPNEVTDLLTLLENRWVLHSRNHIVERHDIQLGESFTLRFGPLRLRLPDILPLSRVRRLTSPGSGAFYQADLFADGWKVERITLYRPLVYFCCFVKDDVYEQLRLSLQSLVEFAHYTDDVLIVCDRPPEAVLGLVPLELRGRVHVRQITVRRALDYMTARYRIADWGPAEGFQPLLYTDTDVIFDLPLQPLLAELAYHPFITAPEEAVRVADSPQLGAAQIQADGVETGDRRGFNSGTQGLANLAMQGDALRLVHEALQRWDREQVARGAPEVWEDQPMANYIAVKTGCYDTGLMSRHVRFDHPMYRVGPATSPEGRRGMVHFWGPPTYWEKCELMEAYLRVLRAGGG